MQPGARSVGTGDQIWQVVPRLGDCEEQRMHCFNQTDSQDKTSDEGHEWSRWSGVVFFKMIKAS